MVTRPTDVHTTYKLLQPYNVKSRETEGGTTSTHKDLRALVRPCSHTSHVLCSIHLIVSLLFHATAIDFVRDTSPTHYREDFLF
jgi:hypothetical protein